ncbi:MAG: integrase, partial [Bacillota bacterium]
LVQATLGHASVATTGRYLHARPNDSSARFLCAP